MAHYIHDTMLRHVAHAWATYKDASGARGISAYNAFSCGLIDGFADQLKQSQSHRSITALVPHGNAAVNAFFKRRHPRTRATHLSASRDADARKAGHQEGLDLHIRKPVGTKGQRLLR